MIEAIVIGAGQAGLAVSHHLARRGIEHVVLERGRVGETWRSQRWDSFALNTPGWYSRLPGDATGLEPLDSFAGRDAFVAYLAGYAERWHLPVRTGVAVTSVQPSRDGFLVTTDPGEPLHARSVVFAAGSQRVARIPEVAASLPRRVGQLHSAAYRQPAGLPKGAVLVVGSGQSGSQITEDLLDAGRTVYLATSRVGRTPRRYRGRDSFEWLFDTGFFAQTVAQLPDPATQFAAQPLVSGVGRHGHTVSLQWLAGRGAILLGRLEGVRDGRLVLRDDVAANVRWGDERAADFRQSVEAWIANTGVETAEVEPDEADVSDPHADLLHSPDTLDLETKEISSVIWTTGVTGDYGWLPPAAIGSDGRPLLHQGESPMPGLVIVGLPWLRNRASGIIGGSDADGAMAAELIVERSRRRDSA